MKFLDNMTHRQRTDTAKYTAVIEGSVAFTQVIIAMTTGNAANWFVAIFAIAVAAITWVVFMPKANNG